MSADSYPGEYETHESDCIGPTSSGDVCPWCGECLCYEDDAANLSGETGSVLALAPEDVTVPIYHRTCWEECRVEARRQQNRDLTEWAT